MARNGDPDWPIGDGDMAARIRGHDWASSPLGPIETWPQRLRTAVDIVVHSGHAMQLAWGPERIILYNDAYAPMLGERHPSALGRPFRQAWPEIWDEIEPLVARVFAGETVRFAEMPLVMTRHGYAEETWWNFSYSPVRDEAGDVAGLLNVTVDATAKIRADQAEQLLRDREERQAFLLHFSDTIRVERDPALLADHALRLFAEKLKLARCYLVQFDIAADRADFPYQHVGTGLQPLPDGVRLSDFPASVRKVFDRTLVVDDIEADPALSDLDRQSLAAIGQHSFVAAALRLGRHDLVSALVAVSAAPRHWTAVEIALIEDVAERIWTAVERARAEQALHELQARQEVLVAELQHRTFNLLGMVRATADTTIRSSSDLDDFQAKFSDRIDALARVQRLLSRLREDHRVTFDELLRAELEAAGALEGGRVALDGPVDVALRSRTVQIFAMAIHELTTNAVKYGALGQPAARLDVRWRVETDEKGDPWLHLDWRESGVAMPPADAAPGGTGQGRLLIEQALPYQLRARTDYVVAADGIRCSIALPLSKF